MCASARMASSLLVLLLFLLDTSTTVVSGQSITSSLPAAFFNASSGVNFVNGSVLQLLCTADPPSAVIIWERGGTVLNNDPPHIRIRSNNDASTVTSILTVDDFQTADNGVYQCSVGETEMATTQTLTAFTPMNPGDTLSLFRHPSTRETVRDPNLQPDNRSAVAMGATIDTDGTSNANLLLRCVAAHTNDETTSHPLGTLVWTRNGQVLTAGGRVTLTPLAFPLNAMVPNRYGADLQITGFMTSDAGIYQCIATDNSTSDSDVVTSPPFRLDTGDVLRLERVSPEVILLTPPNKLVIEVKASGRYMEITWTKDGSPLVVDSPNELPNFAEIFVRGVTAASDLGTYTVQLTTLDATQTRQPESLVFQVIPPPPTLMFNNMALENGSAINITDIGQGLNDAVICQTTSPHCCRQGDNPSGPALGKWFFPDGSLVRNSDSAGEIYMVRETGRVRLNRRNDAPSPTGFYRCDVTSPGGIVQSVFVELRASTVVTLNGTVYTNNSVVPLTDIGMGDHALLCTTDNTQCCGPLPSDNRDPIGEWYFPNGDLVLDGQDPSRNIFRNRGPSVVRLNRRSNAQSPTGLYRCEIPDASGTNRSIYINLTTDIVPTTTPPPATTSPTTAGTTATAAPSTTPTPEPVPFPPTSLTSSSQAPTSITLSWEQPAGDVVERYDIVYTYQRGCGPPPTMTQFQGTTTTQMHMQENLEEFSNYSVTVTAVNSVGESAPANGTFTTAPAAPSGAPRNVRNTSVTFSTITIQWDRVRCIDRNSDITGYTVRYGQTGSTTTDMLVPVTSGNNRMFTATGLTPGTSYTFQVAAVGNEVGDGIFSPTFSVVTFAPTVILNGTVYTNNSAVLLTDIGVGDHALLCHTDNTQCCSPMDGAPIGEWYFPNGSLVLDGQDPSRNIFRNRGPSVVRLNRRNNAQSPTGLYRCEIPDASGTVRNIYINLTTDIIPTTAPPPATTPPTTPPTTVGTTPPTAPPTTPPPGPTPSPPTSLTSTSQSPTSITLSWNQTAGDVVDRYDIVYTYQGGCIDYTQPEDMATVNDGTARQYTVEGLEEFSAYDISVFAFNGTRRSSAATAMATTAPSAPSGAPQSMLMSEVASTSITIRWSRVNCIDRNSDITGYTVRYGQTGSNVTDVSVSGTSDSERMFTARELTPGTSYTFQVAAVSNEGTGDFSTAFSLEAAQPKPASSIAGTVVGVVFAIILVIIVIVIILVVMWILRRKGRLQFAKGSHENNNTHLVTSYSKHNEEAVHLKDVRYSKTDTLGAAEAQLNGQNDGQDGADDYFEDFKPMLKDSALPISVSEFGKHVRRMHADRDKLFESEFESLAKQPQSAITVARTPHNKQLNRFGNIFPYDFNRVTLAERDGSDYINASFIDGYNKEKAYIAAQGPTANSVEDFWRMVWEYKLPTIVMLTRCFEGKKKCEQYWPEKMKDKKDVGNGLSVKMTSFLPFAEYDIRKLVVTDTANPNTPPLRVMHMHYTIWPDHGVPLNAISLIHFAKKVRKEHAVTHPSPLLVHCSAGVGRTGSFVVLDVMLQRMKEEGNFNIYECVTQLRTQRVFMVQTASQYMFVHDALDELITCGETDITAGNIRIALNKLSKIEDGEGRTGFQRVFKTLQLVSSMVKKIDCKAAKDGNNLSKNRYPNKVPNDHNRVFLKFDGASNSDYINASFIHGYKHRRAYIATQGPLKGTVNDFWRMLLEFNSKCIVMLCNTKEDGKEACYPYWPLEKGTTVSYGKLHVTLTSEANLGDFTVRKLEVLEDRRSTSTAGNGGPFTVTQFHVTRWTHQQVPATQCVLKLVEQVNKVQMNSGNKAITVMCNDGVGRSGAFMTIHTQLERLKTEGVVDVFQSLKSARIQRAGLVDTVDQFAFCFEVLADYLDEFELYANFKDVV